MEELEGLVNTADVMAEVEETSACLDKMERVPPLA
jgi:hypothetical protein